MFCERPRDDRSVSVQRDALGNVIISGDHNSVFVYHRYVQTSYGSESGKEFNQAPLEKVHITSGSLELNPYKGINFFQEEDANIYFGRGEQVQRLLNSLEELAKYSDLEKITRFLPVLGASGSGKSSLIRAGLLPALARHLLPGFRKPRVVVMTPGEDPLYSLAVALASIADNGIASPKKSREFRDELKIPNTDGRYDGLRRIADTFINIDLSPLIIVIDQFEEVYSSCKNTKEQKIFIENLLEAATTLKAKVFVIAALRIDFLGATQQHLQLNQIFCSDRNLIVGAMTQEELKNAIAQPAIYAGRPFEETFINLLIEQTKIGGEGTLPLLQFTLEQIWKRREKGESPSAVLKSLDGVGGALAKKAQQEYDEKLKNDKQRSIAKRIFLSLVENMDSSDINSSNVNSSDLNLLRVDLDRLKAKEDDDRTFRYVIGVFSAQDVRLITLSCNSKKQYVAEITHRALLDHWPQLIEWLNEGLNDMVFHRRLEDAALYWDRNHRPEGSLWRSPDLDSAFAYRKKHRHDMSSLQIDFYMASLQAKRKTKRAKLEAERAKRKTKRAKLEAERAKLEAERAKLEAERAKRKAERRATRNKYLLTSLSLILTASLVFAQRQQSEGKFWAEFSSIFVEGSTDPKNFNILPKALQIARRDAEKGLVNEAIARNKAILRVAHNYTKATSFMSPQIKITDIENIKRVAEDNLAKLIDVHFITPKLLKEIENNSIQIGGINKNINDLQKFENQYYDGALKTTYIILMRKPGLGLDENDNGRLDKDEIIYLPCETLQKLEYLWRRLTNNRCGFYGYGRDTYDLSGADSCWELSGFTLSYRIFHSMDVNNEDLENRLNSCQVIQINDS